MPTLPCSTAGKKNLEDSRYVWLPLEFGKDGTITIPWRDSWDPRTQWEEQGDFSAGKGTFLLNGKPFVIKAAELHYPRIPKAYWDQRIKLCKALGMNTICLYVFWNSHESQPECSTSPDRMTWRNSAAYASRMTCMSSCARDRMSVPNGKWADCPGGYSRKDIRLRESDPTLWSV